MGGASWLAVARHLVRPLSGHNGARAILPHGPLPGEAGLGQDATPYRSRVVGLLFQLLLSVGLLALFLLQVDLSEVRADLRALDLRWAALGAVAISASRAAQISRWRLLLRRWTHLPLRLVTAIFLVGNLASALLPLRLGDAVRVRLADRRLHIPPAELTATIFVLETLLDWVTSVVMLGIALILFVTVSEFVLSSFVGFTILVISACAALILLSGLDRQRDLSERRPVRWLAPRFRSRSARLLAQFLQGLDTMRQPRWAARAFAASVAIWLLEVTFYYMMARAFALDLSFADCFLVMIVANLILALPLTPGQIGTYEVGVSGILRVIGVPAETAAGFALAAHAVLMVWLGIVGLVALWWLHPRPSDLFAKAPDPPSTEQTDAAAPPR